MTSLTEPWPGLGNSRALLIGTSRFDEPAFADIPAAVHSVDGMEQVLTDPVRGVWLPGQVSKFLDPRGSTRLIQRIRRAAETVTDVLLLYYVGHGLISETGHLILTVADTAMIDPDLTGIEYTHIDRAIRTSPARVAIVILDCCYSGRAITALGGSEIVADVTSIEGAYTLTAAAEGPAHVKPYDPKTIMATSFTQELLDLLREGIPGGPKNLTVHTIYGQLVRRLRQRGLPRPNQRGTDTVHNFVLARNASHAQHLASAEDEGEQRVVARHNADAEVLPAYRVDPPQRARQVGPGKRFKKGSADVDDIPGIDVVLRGYDRRQVNQYVRQCMASAPMPLASPPDFDLALRGYDCAQVREYLESLGFAAPQ
ncbi:caspase family protein [Actinomadura sp. K4S16]|uniref:caspase family protein n=1 Tax=Actinomadura sp. K4S16 TaxID=1316147 RepID=UPI001F1CE3D8|nr:caspase family protein [Actinomadura sp. K4S16]